MGFLSPMRGVLVAVRNAAQKGQPPSVANKVANDVAAVAGNVARLGRRFTGFKKGGEVSSGRGNGIAVRGKTKCKMY